MAHQDLFVADYDVNEVTSSTEIADQNKRQLQQEIETEQRIFEEIDQLDEDARVLNLCERNKRSLDRQVTSVQNAAVKTDAAISKNEGHLEVLDVSKNELEINIKSAKKEMSDLKIKLKKMRYCYQKGMRRTKFIQSLLKEYNSLVDELAELESSDEKI